MKRVLVKVGAIASLTGILALPAQASAAHGEVVEAVALAALFNAAFDDGYQKVHYPGHAYGYYDHPPRYRYWDRYDRRAYKKWRRWQKHHRHAHRHGKHRRHFYGHGHGYRHYDRHDRRHDRHRDRRHDRDYRRDRRHH